MIFIYEIDKKHPVGIIFDSGYEISLDPWDVEEVKQFGMFEWFWEGVQK